MHLIFYTLSRYEPNFRQPVYSYRLCHWKYGYTPYWQHFPMTGLISPVTNLTQCSESSKANIVKCKKHSVWLLLTSIQYEPCELWNICFMIWGSSPPCVLLIEILVYLVPNIASFVDHYGVKIYIFILFWCSKNHLIFD